MTGLGIVWDILIVCGVLFIIVMIYGDRLQKGEAQKAIKMLKKIEEIYDKYISKKIVTSIVGTNSLEMDLEAVIEETITVIKPEIEGIINLINASTYTGISMKYDSAYFSNIVSLIQQLFDTSQKNEEKKLSKEEVDTMYESFRIAIKADVKKRLLEY